MTMMKRLYRHITRILLLTPLVLVSACMESDLFSSRVPITLTAGGEEQVVTRGALAIQGAYFDKDEKISAYINTSAGNWIGNPTTYTTYAVYNHVNELSPDEQPYFPSETSEKVNIYAYYPQKVKYGDTSFKVLDNQTKDYHYKESDLMFASLKDLTNTSEKLHLKFSHLMSKIIISTKCDDGLVVDYFRLVGVKRGVTLNSLTGVVSAPSDQGEIRIDSVAGAIVFPEQTVTGSFLEVHTTDGGVSTFSLNGKTFKAGWVYTLNVAVSTANNGRTVGIDWADEIGTVTVAPYGSTGLTVSTLPSVVYRPSPPIEPVPEVTYAGSPLVNNTDYECAYYANDRVGRATVLITGLGQYKGLALATSFDITQATGSLSYAKSSVKIDYDQGLVVDNKLTIVGDGTMTYKSTDEKVATVENGVVRLTGVGETTITATMAGDKNYTGATASFTLTVEGKDITNEAVSGVKISISPTEYTYNGTARKPTVTMTDNGTTVSPDFYEVHYTDSIHRGTGHVTIVGKNKYAGTVVKDYTIKQATTTITLSDKEVGMLKGGTYNDQVVTVNHNYHKGQYTYASSATSVATVSASGLVTATSSPSFGTANSVSATITVSLATNEYQDWESKSTTYTVVIPKDMEYAYSGSYATWECPVSGRYRLDVWGAQGGNATKDGLDPVAGGKGAHIAGTVYVTKGTNLYVYVGGQGILNQSKNETINGWNGGGGIDWTQGNSGGGTWSTADPITGGGGGTDISVKDGAWNSSDHLHSRIIVAGGGGGGLIYTMENLSGGTGYSVGGAGGAYNGADGGGDDKGHGATISGPGGAANYKGTAGKFGIGGDFWYICEGAGAGGGGWYGGGSGGHGSNNGSGGGGSSYIWNATNATYYPTPRPSTDYYMIELEKQPGVREGNGQATIKFYSRQK